jgi:hypothetical protein
VSNSRSNTLENTLQSIEKEDQLIHTLITQKLLKLLRSKEKVDVRDILDLMVWRESFKQKIQNKLSHNKMWGNYKTTE